MAEAVTLENVTELLAQLRQHAPRVDLRNDGSSITFPRIEGLDEELSANALLVLSEGKMTFIGCQDKNNNLGVQFMDEGHAANAQRFMKNLRTVSAEELTEALQQYAAFEEARGICMNERFPQTSIPLDQLDDALKQCATVAISQIRAQGNER